ncbi:hypothetical protein C4D60_Mb02t01500 [Musa balbisiana]|uniref:Uncharacterized protein n=1 Tax=Musa balbisiana TaxID=52838 RepID=A0A4S8I7R6_MUSBA|nr:hypothetical protein C4D60_Mb02t01500 [Musa balbisiana]
MDPPFTAPLDPEVPFLPPAPPPPPPPPPAGILDSCLDPLLHSKSMMWGNRMEAF